MTTPGIVHVPSTDGVEVAVHELGGRRGSPLVLFAHATGFHGRVWDEVARRMVDDLRCVALDFRGHGYSVTDPGRTGYAWTGMVDDVLAVVDHLGGGPMLSVGWSMGGAAIVGAEIRRPGTFRGAYLFEPIMVRSDLDESLAPRHNPLADLARRRRAEFPSHRDAIERYGSRPPFDRVDRAALESYVLHGFAPASDGSVRLRCEPEVEATIFENWRGGLFDDLSSVTCPVVVAIGGEDDSPAGLAPSIVEHLPDARFERFEHLTHFGPLEEPATIAAAIRSFVSSLEGSHR